MADPIEKFREHHDKIIREKQRGVDGKIQTFTFIEKYVITVDYFRRENLTELSDKVFFKV